LIIQWLIVRLTFGLVCQEVIHLLNTTIVGGDGVSVIGHVENNVLTHDGQTNEAQIRTSSWSRLSTDIDAGETRSKLAKEQTLI
jgi:hypothetical protein